ncbi:TolB family protein [Streptomyces sp. URMC 123]|uniref:TolB family protein n=1 Tax=Streptomyces sp. URMC 123 TaxID=3423403 RepID=UPI003F195001
MSFVARAGTVAGVAAGLVMVVGLGAPGPAGAAPGDRPRVELVSAAVGGGPGNGLSEQAVLSRDGRYAVFASDASNLVPGDTNGLRDVFVRDLRDRTTRRVAGPPGTATDQPALSADGRYLAFTAATGTGHSSVHVRDLRTGATERVDVGLGDYEGGAAREPAISADGRQVAFTARAGDPEKADGSRVYLRDRATGRTERISHQRPDWQPRDAFAPTLSDDGRTVAYQYNHSNGPRADCCDAYLRDRATGALVQLDARHDGSAATRESMEPSLSADGRRTVLESADTGLVPGDDDNAWNVFVREVGTGAVRRVQHDGGGPRDAFTRSPVISADGRHLLYRTWEAGVFVKDLDSAAPARRVVGGAGEVRVRPGALGRDASRVVYDDYAQVYVRYLR